MSESDKSLQEFLQRWSRRKRAAVERTDAGAKAPSDDGQTKEVRVDANDHDAEARDESERAAPDLPARPSSSAAAFDPASLPPIESIDATTDVRAFLAPGVPPELTRAALRRAWASDPAIRDFIGIAENQWDFTQPDTVPGFGTLEITPALRRMVADLFGQSPAEKAQSAEQAVRPDCPKNVPETSTADAATDVTKTVTPAVGSLSAAPQQIEGTDAEPLLFPEGETADQPATARRKHGGALPK